MQKQEAAGMPGLFYQINTSKTGSKTGLKASKTGRAFKQLCRFYWCVSDQASYCQEQWREDQ